MRELTLTLNDPNTTALLAKNGFDMCCPINKIIAGNDVLFRQEENATRREKPKPEPKPEPKPQPEPAPKKETTLAQVEKKKIVKRAKAKTRRNK